MKNQTWIRRTAILLMALISLSTSFGCATPAGSAGVGAVAGGVTGAGVGALADPGARGQNRFRNVIIGTAVGSALGAGAGFMLGQHVKDERDAAHDGGKKEALRESESHAGSLSGNSPRLIPARTEARWVPDQVRGSTFVPGHFEYLIIEGARWDND